MPYKSKKKRAEYMRKYREDKKQILVDKKKIEELRRRFPHAYDLIFGKPRQPKRKKPKKHKK